MIHFCTVKYISDIFGNAAKHTFGTNNPKQSKKEPTILKKGSRIHHGLTLNANTKEDRQGALKDFTDYLYQKKIHKLKNQSESENKKTFNKCIKNIGSRNEI